MEYIRSIDALDSLGLPGRMVDSLTRQGLRTVGELLDADEETLPLHKNDRALLRMWLNSLLSGAENRVYLDWGTALPARKGKLSWSLDGQGVLTIWGSGTMLDYTDSTVPPWDGFRQEIRELVVEEGVRNIGARAFRNCTALEYAGLAPSVESIGTEAFAACAQMDCAYTARSWVHLREKHRPENALIVGHRAFYGIPRVRMCFGEYYIVDGVLLDYFGAGGDIVIPEGVREIGTMAFESLPITAVTFPVSLEVIGPFAFRGTKLRRLTLPRTIRQVREYAFANTPLEQVILGSQKIRIHDDAFAGTPVAPHAGKIHKKYPSIYGLGQEPVPGITCAKKLSTGMTRPFGTRYYNSKRELRRVMGDGSCVLRLRLDKRRKLVTEVQVFGACKSGGHFTAFFWPCRREDGAVEIWRQEDYFLSSWYFHLCRTQELRPSCPGGSWEWFVAPWFRETDSRTPLALLKQWLTLHPDYSVPTEAQRESAPAPSTDPR